MVAAHAAGAPTPRPGCQANAWNLEPARFDLPLTAMREMKELEFQGFETNIRFLQPKPDAASLDFVGAHTSLPEYDKAGPEGAAAVAKLAPAARQVGTRTLIVSHPGLSPAGEFSEAALAAKVRVLDLCATARGRCQPRASLPQSSPGIPQRGSRSLRARAPHGPSRRTMKTVFGV